MSPAPHPPVQPYLKAIDIQDGDGQRVLLRGHQRVDPGDEPAEEQRVQHLGDGVSGAEKVLGQVGTVWGWGQGSGVRRGGARPHLASTALSTVSGVKIFSRIVSWGGMRPLNDSRLAAASRKPPKIGGAWRREPE